MPSEVPATLMCTCTCAYAADLPCIPRLIGSLKVGSKKSSVGCGENESPLTQLAMFSVPEHPVAPVPVTPCFLPPEALAALQERGMVGSVAQVLD